MLDKTGGLSSGITVNVTVSELAKAIALLSVAVKTISSEPPQLLSTSMLTTLPFNETFRSIFPEKLQRISSSSKV